MNRRKVLICACPDLAMDGRELAARLKQVGVQADLAPPLCTPAGLAAGRARLAAAPGALLYLAVQTVGRWRGRRLGALHFWAALPVLLLAYWGVVAQAATDNLTELIAAPQPLAFAALGDALSLLVGLAHHRRIALEVQFARSGSQAIRGASHRLHALSRSHRAWARRHQAGRRDHERQHRALL